MTREKTIKRLFENGLSLNKIARQLNENPSTVRYAAVKMGLYQPKHKKVKNGEAKCNFCLLTKPVNQFPQLKKSGKYKCSDCYNLQYLDNSEYQELVRKFGEKCSICCSKIGHYSKNGNPCKLAIDHDHKTGKVRGLLCGNCNRGIGYLKDDILILEKAIKYLKLHQPKNRPKL